MRITDQHEEGGNTFSDDELFDYVDGQLAEERKKELEVQLALDKELQAKFNVVRRLVNATEDIGDAESRLVDSLSPKGTDQEGD